MTSSHRYGAGPTTLEARVKAIEHRLYQRRSAIRMQWRGIADGVRDRLTAPQTIAIAGLVGVILGRVRILRGLKPIAIIQVVNAATRLWQTAASGVAGSADRQPESVDRH